LVSGEGNCTARPGFGHSVQVSYLDISDSPSIRWRMINAASDSLWRISRDLGHAVSFSSPMIAPQAHHIQELNTTAAILRADVPLPLHARCNLEAYNRLGGVNLGFCLYRKSKGPLHSDHRLLSAGMLEMQLCYFHTSLRKMPRHLLLLPVPSRKAICKVNLHDDVGVVCGSPRFSSSAFVLSKNAYK